MNNSLCLPRQMKKSILKSKPTIKLPAVDKSIELRYQNDYENYQQQFNAYKNENNTPLIKTKQKTKKSLKVMQIEAVALSYEQSPQFWSSKFQKVSTNPYSTQPIYNILVSYSAQSQYQKVDANIINEEIIEMRVRIQQLNNHLNEKLNAYNLAKSQLKQKELITQSNSQFYQRQVQTNSKIQQQQIEDIRKLQKKELQIKDRDLIFQLENLLNQLKDQLHIKNKQDHDQKLKNHKNDRKLDDLIHINTTNADNNLVKVLNLQIVYYSKRINNLKTYQQQLNSELEIIVENDKNLEKKHQQLRISKFYNQVTEEAQNLKQKYRKLKQKKQTLNKNIQTLKRSNDITQEKTARQLLKYVDQLQKGIRPLIKSFSLQNDKLCQKIQNLMYSNQVSQESLQSVKHKFSDQLTFNSRAQTKAFLKNILKPNLRLNLSKMSGYKNMDKKRSQSQFELESTKNFISRKQQIKLSKSKLSSMSNQKLTGYRYNDKNMTIDVVNDQQSNSSSIIKPEKFKNLTARNHDKSLKDQSTNFQDNNKSKLHKPLLLISKNLKK